MFGRLFALTHPPHKVEARDDGQEDKPEPDEDVDLDVDVETDVDLYHFKIC